MKQKWGAITFLVMLFSYLSIQWNSQFLSSSEFYQNSIIVKTADDASYIIPMENFVENGTWDNGSTGMTRYTFRSHGVGAWVYLHKLLFGQYAHRMLLFSQLILFGLQTFLFARLLFYFTKSERASCLGQLIYGLLPCNFSFVAYAISEPLTPFFLLLSLYMVIRLKGDFTAKNVLFAIVSSSICLSTRPQLLPFVLGFGLILWMAQSWKKAFIFGVLTFLPMIIWLVRTYNYTDNWSIHSIYHNTNSHLFNPMHEEMTNLFRIWEFNELNFHRVMNQAWWNSTEISINFHSDITDSEKEKISFLVDDFKMILQDYRKICERGEMMPIELLPEVKDLISRTKSMRFQLIENHPSLFYLKTPIKSLGRLILNSGITFRSFQSDLKGVWWVEIIRWICFLVLVSSLVISLFGFFLFKQKCLKILSVVILSYLFYLSFFQRLNEGRYLYPIYGVSTLLLFIFLVKLKNRLIS